MGEEVQQAVALQVLSGEQVKLKNREISGNQLILFSCAKGKKNKLVFKRSKIVCYSLSRKVQDLPTSFG